MHNFTKCFSGTRINQIENKCLNGYLSFVSAICYFGLKKKMMFTTFLLDKEMDDAENC